MVSLPAVRLIPRRPCCPASTLCCADVSQMMMQYTTKIVSLGPMEYVRNYQPDIQTCLRVYGVLQQVPPAKSLSGACVVLLCR